MSVYAYNILFTAVVSIGVVAAIIVYFVLLHRHLRDLQQTIMLEIERLRITIAQISHPSDRRGEIQPEELVDANEEVGADSSQHEKSSGLGSLAEQADAEEGDGASSITQP